MKTFFLEHDLARKNCPDYAMTAPKGWLVRFSEPRRKDIQNDKFHAQIGDIAKQCEFMGEKWSLEDWKRLLVDAFAKAMAEAGTPLRRGGRVVPSLDGGGVVQLGIQTRDFRVKEAAEFIEYLYAWGSHKGVVWSDEPERKAA